MSAARDAMKNAYSPYSKMKVGAAILTKGGEVFTGCNVENGSYGLTLCAERVALAKAVSEGHRDFSAIAVVSDRVRGIVPCGACLQALYEFSPSIKIITLRGNKAVPSAIRTFLPKGFSINEKKSC